MTVLACTRYPTLSLCHATHPNCIKSKAKQTRVAITIASSKARRIISGTKELEYIRALMEY